MCSVSLFQMRTTNMNSWPSHFAGLGNQNIFANFTDNYHQSEFANYQINFPWCQPTFWHQIFIIIPSTFSDYQSYVNKDFLVVIFVHFRHRQKQNQGVHCLYSTNAGNTKKIRKLKEAQYLFISFCKYQK